MTMLGPLGFLAPWLLLGLVVLPVLWVLLRAVPPAPVRRRFPGIALLLGLRDEEAQADRTPWWLLLLRLVAVALVIIGFAGPVLNPDADRRGTGPLLVVLDGSWADARDWPRRIDRVRQVLGEAGRDGRPVAVVTLTDPPAGGVGFQAAGGWIARLPGLEPRAWAPEPEAVAAFAATLEGRFDTLWLSDGLRGDWREGLLAAFEVRGAVRVLEAAAPAVALGPARFEAGVVQVPVLRSRAGEPLTVDVVAQGTDPAGLPSELARAAATLPAEATTGAVALSLPAELRNRVTRFEIAGLRSAGAVTLTDDALRRRQVALVAASGDREGLQLLSPLHFLRQALAPTADLIDGTMDDILLASPDVIVLADVGQIAEAEDLRLWVEAGGLLLRFAGPRLAASDVSRSAEDPLMPVRLRIGGRSVGGAMSWGEPKDLRPFDAGSPFVGLAVPADVRVSAQVMAEPDPELAQRTIASLTDGTPLVTRKRLGEGQVVLFHVTANAEWSTLPLSGLFVQMLERLAVSTPPQTVEAADLAGTIWTPDALLSAFGRVTAADDLPAVPGERLAEARPGPASPPGLYAGPDRRLALNVIGPQSALAPAAWPARVAVEGLVAARALPLKGALLAAALALLVLDVVASLIASGRLRGPRAGLAAALALALLVPPSPGEADEDKAVRAAAVVALGHVLTGDAQIDAIAEAGLRGLGQTLWQRTSIESAEPIAVDLERDELAFYPLLYWPVSVAAPQPSQDAYARLNRYLRGGGMILFDTRDGDTAGFGATTPAGRKLRQLAAPLDIPPLEPVPADHVLTRTFYLLQDFPGRHSGALLWVEAAPADAELADGMPFRNLNDNVTPVVIGGNDWAAAWAVDDAGRWMLPVARGYAGERQREIALRFGVNLVMHVLTGNYKSDQVHVPALLDRLGQ